ncbi:MAG: large conductance mechanosensitive channel protein MscL [Betaproteobacteria bacterium]|nr:large conductance mechanosensitive channel protein MscL [Betaproteobacteria bacterium]MDE2048818.1 large conductance mechanosensitive channel protein MscL [Betaproteobacteria bacterium]
MLKEFRDFAVKGNVIDLAVGVIIGGAFGKIVDSLVKDMIMPVVGKIFGGLDFSNKFILLGDAVSKDGKPVELTYDALSKAGIPMFAYGNFITVLINFLILAFIIFQMVKAFNKAKGNISLDAAAAPPPPTPEDVLLLREIRDALKK